MDLEQGEWQARLAAGFCPVDHPLDELLGGKNYCELCGVFWGKCGLHCVSAYRYGAGEHIILGHTHHDKNQRKLRTAIKKLLEVPVEPVESKPKQPGLGSHLSFPLYSNTGAVTFTQGASTSQSIGLYQLQQDQTKWNWGGKIIND